jgi:hypothetical protein
VDSSAQQLIERERTSAILRPRIFGYSRTSTRWAALPQPTEVLDAGTGIGGTARFVADRCQCRVTAVDLTEEYCETTGWLKHVQMNVADKGGLYREARRVLVQGGRLAMWDITSGGRGELGYPLPWADQPGLSHLGMSSPTRRPQSWTWCCHCLPIRWGCTPSSLALRRRPRTSALPSRTDGCELSNASRERADQVGEYLCDVKPEAMHGI